MSQIPKSSRKGVRLLVEKAYRIELENELQGLDSSFKSWRDGQLNAVELTGKILEFTKGSSQEIRNVYSYLKDPELLARAVVRGLIDQREIEPNVLNALESTIEALRSLENK